MNLIEKETITSLELVEQINMFRGKDNKTILQHNDLLKDNGILPTIERI